MAALIDANWEKMPFTFTEVLARDCHLFVLAKGKSERKNMDAVWPNRLNQVVIGDNLICM